MALVSTEIKIIEPFPEFSEPSATENENEMVKLQSWMAEMRLKGIVLESHVRLFLYEFLEHIGSDFDALLKRYAGDKEKKLKLLHRKAKQQAMMFVKNEKQAERIAKRAVRTELFKFISHSSDPDALPNLLFVIARCRKTDPLAFEELHLNNLQNIDFYVRLFCGPDKSKVDRIRAVLEPKHLITYFAGRNIDEYDPLLNRIRLIYAPEDPEKREIEAAACLLIRGLVHCIDGRKSTRQHGDWYYDFLEGLRSHADCRMIPRFIDPDYQNDLDEWKSRKSVQNPLDETALADLVLDNEKMPSKPRDQRDFARYRITEVVEGYVPAECQLRPYQNELVTQAINGKNTIICAPTGSGKTQIAVHVIRKHLMQRHWEGKVGRCVMLVPTVPLVDQQAQQLTQYLMALQDEYRPDLGYWIEGFSGCENSTEGRAFRLLTADICVMTPQFLINMLNSVLRSERIYLADFTMFVFDECHHCDKQHPYKMLMDSLESSLNQLAERPQIVGLTASMGVGDTSWDMRACREHMLKLCSNLMAETISTVRHQMDDLRRYVMPPVDEVISVKRPANNAFVENIDRVMEEIEQRLHSKLRELVESKKLQLNMNEITFPPHDQQGRYQSMVGVLKKHVQRVQDSTLRFMLVRSIDHLAHYFHAILISDLLPNSYALDYLQGKMANYVMETGKDELELINNRLLDTYKELHQKLTNHVQQEQLQQKQILVHLHRILAEQFSREPNSRCLIFVATRNCAQKLSDHLNTVPELPTFYGKRNVGFMVSSNQSGTAGGQSNQDQQYMRQDFDSGKIKVLVVTSVAEEGVNITACNLIIKYNNVGSERSMIQRRGRARQKNSRSILLALDIGVEQVEYTNMQKEAMMIRCIQDLQEKSEAALKKEIAAKRAQMAAMKEMQRCKLEDKRQLMQAKRYKLCCKSCGNLICRSTFIRTVSDTLYVVCDESVWERSKIDMRDKPTKDQLSTKCARWMCKTCPGMEWGAVVKYSNCYLPQLAAGVFTLEREDQHEMEDFNAGSRRTWNLVQDQFFNVDPIGPTNIRDMYVALVRAMPELIKQMDQRETLANIRYVEKMKEKLDERKTKIQLFLEE